MNRVNITFTPHTVAKASEMNEVVAKVNELVDGKLDTSHNTSSVAHQELFAQTVKISGTQRIAGDKTFVDSVYLPNRYSQSGGNVLAVNSEDEVTADYMPYFRFIGNLNTDTDLPSANAVRVGDVYHINDSGGDYYARSVTRNYTLTVNIDSASTSTRLSSTTIDVSQYTPITTSRLSELVSSVTFDANYPSVPSSGISDNQQVLNYTLGFYGSRVCFIPVSVQNYGTILVMMGYERSNPRPVWALGGSNSNVSIWHYHIHGQGEIIDVSQGITQSMINAGTMQTFQPLGGSVTWETFGFNETSINVSSLFASTPTMPNGYTISQLQGKSLYAVIDGNRFPVTLKYDSSTQNGIVYYMDFDGGEFNIIYSEFSTT